MSMISAQVDELRELATRCDELQAGAVKAVKMPSDMGSILRDDADTILSLRDKAQELQAENAKLRERIHELEMEGSDHFYRTAYAEDANRTLEAENARLRERSAKTLEVGTRWMAKAARFESENAKLRELALNLYAEWRFAHARMRYIVLQHEERMREIEQRMCELGVEVLDGD